MEIISFWLFTLTLSEGLRIQTELRILKDLADNGFKINNVGNNIYFDSKTTKEKEYLILRRILPGINIMDALEKMVEYRNTRNILVDSFLIKGSLSLMTDVEQKIYEENPTPFTAFKINLKNDMKLNNAKTVILDDGTEVWFDFGREKNNKDEIVIYKSIGPSSNESMKVQKSLVLNTLQSRLNKSIQEEKAKSKNLSEETQTSKKRKEKIELLEAMKKTLLNKKQAEKQSSKVKKLK